MLFFQVMSRIYIAMRIRHVPPSINTFILVEGKGVAYVVSRCCPLGRAHQNYCISKVVVIICDVTNTLDNGRRTL